MREKYESLALVDLKAIAKARGLKGTSAMKKSEIIELMLAEDEKEKASGRHGLIELPSLLPQMQKRRSQERTAIVRK